MSSVFIAQKVNPPPEPIVEVKKSSTPIPVDVYRLREKLIVLAPIAGITIEEINVTITDDVLTIKGNRRHPDSISKQDYFSQECFWGEFSRTIVLPVNVDTKEVAAFYKRGVLRIELPILEEAMTRVIPVEVEGE